ncbi:capsid cement protein [Streptosporangium roseum]|uniref:capsid cement protein n=1 Tax=Streptosporangium roseum TaxID=2001 RepID=UPI0004CDDBD4|nr:capsid cement protein [Streptosporangium roseum]
MGDYIPVYTPGEAYGMTASAAITGGQQVEVTGSGTVGPAAADSLKVIGVAAFDAASGARVTVWSSHVVHEVTNGSGATITAGDLLSAAASGGVKGLAVVTTPTAADVTNTRGCIGVAITTAANGAKVRYAAFR